ncbi:hypothetical protein Btru_052953 [Bulinus truncatus]|nr:hypothetical protein Btru_052953 [Bulinus truncatus]
MKPTIATSSTAANCVVATIATSSTAANSVVATICINSASRASLYCCRGLNVKRLENRSLPVTGYRNTRLSFALQQIVSAWPHIEIDGDDGGEITWKRTLGA